MVLPWDFSPLSFTGPVTAAHWIHTAQPSVQSSRYLLVASSGTLLLFDTQASPPQKTSILVVNKDRIHVIASLPNPNDPSTIHILLGAGRQVAHAFLNLNTLQITLSSKKLLDDFVLAASFFQDQQQNKSYALVATSHHSVHLLDLESSALQIIQKQDCKERPFLWSASFSLPLYHHLQDVRLASGSVWADVLVWQPFRTHELELKLTGHNVGFEPFYQISVAEFDLQGTIFGVSFSPSGSNIASCSDDHTVCVWTSLTGGPTPQRIFWGHQARVWRVSWMDEDILASAGEDAKILLWNTRTGEKSGGWHQAHDGKSIWALDVQRDLRIVASGGADGQVRWLKESATLALLSTCHSVDLEGLC